MKTESRPSGSGAACFGLHLQKPALLFRAVGLSPGCALFQVSRLPCLKFIHLIDNLFALLYVWGAAADPAPAPEFIHFDTKVGCRFLLIHGSCHAFCLSASIFSRVTAHR